MAKGFLLWTHTYEVTWGFFNTPGPTYHDSNSVGQGKDKDSAFLENGKVFFILKEDNGPW